EMIRYWGYPIETHDVITADGYILNLFRIPHGRASGANSSCYRPAILLVHGLGVSSPEWLMNPPESSPAYIFADTGFDVFLMNHRGSTYSKRHMTLMPWDNKYWQFTVDELAKYDAPAVIDKVLALTGQHATYWVGNSQGTLTGFMALADTPAYNSKVKALIQVGPVGSSYYSKGIFEFLIHGVYKYLKPIADFYRVAFGAHEISQGIPLLFRPLIKLCLIIPLGREVCESVVHLSFGPVAPTFNTSRVGVYLSHAPSGTSTWNILHLAQNGLHRRVEHMDHNPLENLQRYGQETPTPYNYSNIVAPVYLFWGPNDWGTTQDDVEKYLLKELRNEVGSFEVPGYNHLDFMLATDNADKVWNPIVEIVRNLE
ncbi:hypothetical protein PENTCL1PPCAC_14283, partial [Pristionchus entomophagus]